MHQQSGPSLSASTLLWVLTRTPGGSPAPSAGQATYSPCSREAPGPLSAGFQLGHRRGLGWQVWLCVHPLRAPSPSSHRSCLCVPPQAALLPSPLLCSKLRDFRGCLRSLPDPAWLLSSSSPLQPHSPAGPAMANTQGPRGTRNVNRFPKMLSTDTNVPQRHQPRGPGPQPGGHKSLSGRSPRAGAPDPGRSQAGGPPGPGRLRTHARAGSFSAPGSPWHVNQRLEALN